MATISLSRLPLEGDGIVKNLFHFLWSKDELDNGPRINIPDTVIYEFRQPATWYFTSKSGTIKKKSRYNLSNIRIEEAFTRNNSMGSDIVAYYLSTNAEGTTTIEYFDQASLRDFLYNREKEDNGILQKFVEPKGTRNVMVRVVWSPKILLLERRENRHHLFDTKYSLYERAVTYEGAEHYSRAAPVKGSILPVNVQAVCKDVMDHVAEVSFRKSNISRMAVNFKVDADDNIWLLWCTSLRLEQIIPVPTPNPARSGSPSHSHSHGHSHGASPNLSTSSSSHELGFRHSVASNPPAHQRVPSKQGPVSLQTHCAVPSSVMQAFGTTRASRANGTLLSADEVNPPSATAPGGDSVFAGGGHSGGSASASELQQQQQQNVVPIQASECRSCGSDVLLHCFYRVPYNTVVAHYERFMAGLAAHSGGSMKVEWPPGERVVKAVGGVGLGPLRRLRESIRASKDKSRVVIAPEDIEIPPIIRAAHPNLGCGDYRRFRRDPMFLYKTSAVCEDCYLVFADVSSSAAAGAGGASGAGLFPADFDRNDVAKVHRIKHKNHRAQQAHVERTSRLRREKKDKRRRLREQKRIAAMGGPAAAAAAAAAASGRMHASRSEPNFLAAKAGPTLPPRIDETNVQSMCSSPVMRLLLREDCEAKGEGNGGGQGKGHEARNNDDDDDDDDRGVPEELRRELQERESAFFRDLYKNPNLDNGHPLSHMVATQAKLSIAKASVTPGGAQARRPPAQKRLQPLQGGSGTNKDVDWNSPYARSQVVTPLPRERPSRAGQGQGQPEGAGSGSNGKGTAAAGDRARPASSDSKGAAEHRDFLLSTLERVQEQLANPMALHQAVGIENAAHEIREGRNMDAAFAARNDALRATPTDLGRVLRAAVQIGGERLMAGVDLQMEDFHITVFNPRIGLSQRVDVPIAVVLENAPRGVTDSKDLARFLLDSLQPDIVSDLVPNATSVFLPFQ